MSVSAHIVAQNQTPQNSGSDIDLHYTLRHLKLIVNNSNSCSGAN